MDKQIRMEEYAGYQYIEGGVCAAQGFTANGLNCGLNPDKAKNDLGMVYSERPVSYTHLDVYKRQTMQRQKYNSRNIIRKIETSRL